MIESILLTTTLVKTFFHQDLLTQATAFFFEREGRLYLLTSRHVLLDEDTIHHPDRIEIELHADPDNIASQGVARRLGATQHGPIQTADGFAVKVWRHPSAQSLRINKGAA